MIQMITCKCGSIFAACLEPDCYTDKDWIKNLAKYVKKGCTIKMISHNTGFQFEQCKCKIQTHSGQLKLEL